MIDMTSFPERSVVARAQELQDLFEKFPPFYRHGLANRHLTWLLRTDELPRAAVVRFFNAWRPLSRHQPQILSLLAAAFGNPLEQKTIVMNNLLEEGGFIEGCDPHWVLLDNLIMKLGGVPKIVKRSEEAMRRFHRSIWRPMKARTAAGYIAGIENPALDISAYFCEVVRRCGFEHLLADDPYLRIHTIVEVQHVVDSHESALRHMEKGARARADVLAAFEEVMEFWTTFWDVAFGELMRHSEAA